MGLFLAMSSVVGSKPPEVEACIREFVARHGGSLGPATGALPEYEEARTIESQAGTTFVYPDGFAEWDEVSAELSAKLDKPTFSFHIHDGDLWMFTLFVNGNEVLKFNPIPDYWMELDEAERTKWLPSADAVAQYVPGATADKLAPYLVPWPPDGSGLEGKAHPEDEFEFIDWQVVDFMRQLGFHYPDPGEGVAFRFVAGNLS